MQIHDFIRSYSKNLVERSPFCIDFDKYIEDTKNLNIEVHERLRQLAIALENEYFEEKEKWKILNSIYEQAIQENEDWLIYESKGIAACCIMDLTSDNEFESILFKESEKAYQKSIQLGNVNERIYYSLGLLYYGKNYDLAIKNLKIATQKNSQYDMANMYLGYSSFDIENWDDCIVSFRKVNKENLRGYWEQVKRYELIGCALVEKGAINEGLKMLRSKVISEYEKRNYRYSEVNQDTLAHPSEMLRLFEKLNMKSEMKRITKLIE